MKHILQTAVLFAAATIITGCGGPHFTYQPMPSEHEPQNAQPEAAHTYEHKLRPDPDYDPSENEGLAERLETPRPKPTPIFKRHVPVIRQSSRRPEHLYEHGYYQTAENPEDYHWQKSGRHYANTLFYGGIGALVGSAYGHAERGAAVGAAYGHLLDHQSLGGLLTPGTIGGATAGAVFSGNRTKGAIWGAVTGHLLEDIFGR